MYKELGDVINDSSKNDDIQMVVLTGTGDFFTSGNEFNVSLLENTKRSVQTFKYVTVENKNNFKMIQIWKENINFREFVDAVIKCNKLLVAIVNGPAIGIGVTVLALFDIVYASEKV